MTESDSKNLDPASAMSDADLHRLYGNLYLIRRAEEEVARIYPSDKIKSPVHLSIGQEAISVGVIDVLEKHDIVGSTYRGHAAYLAKGGSVGAMFAEMYGKETGSAGGKGGSMHLVDMENGFLGSSAVVGTGIPLAAGYAMSMKKQKKNAVVTCFFGDGATEEGVFYETLNFASLHKLPILFICENNGLAIHEPLSARWATDKLCQRVETFGLPAHRIEDGDVFKVRQTASNAVNRIRAGEGPEFMECLTYRWREHVGPNEDYSDGYRAESDVDLWKQNDQVARVAAMIEVGIREEIEAKIENQIAVGVDFAENSKFPAQEMLHADVFAE
jgi:TPP-dependent pyruvate/acetoin dehydrogenase alpha subunit